METAARVLTCPHCAASVAVSLANGERQSQCPQCGQAIEATYKVLARRFRPQAFEEVIGQEAIGQALRNAVRQQRTAHAYLFTGARGVGKTSMARILAKALNCPHVRDGEPCNQCETCLAIAEGRDLDVSEIDGASNRGIDDIRLLRSNVNVKSMKSPYKVYIIDEVHMLTKEAFNALLKTLEEPPLNVRFIFCTTEPNKVPDTILSRCQRYDFGHIATTNIEACLKRIAEHEGVQVTSEAVELVARRAAGSMRDSQSLMESVLAFGADPVTAEEVHRLLGTAPDDRLMSLVDSLINRDRATVLQLVEESLAEGVQIASLVDQLIHYLRDLMVVEVSSEVPLASVTSGSRERLKQQAARWGLRTVVAALQILSETKSRMQKVTFDRALAELGLIRMTLLKELDEIANWLASGQAKGVGGPLPRATLEGVSRQVKPARENQTAPAGTVSPDPRSPQDAGRDRPTAPSIQPAAHGDRGDRTEMPDSLSAGVMAPVSPVSSTTSAVSQGVVTTELSTPLVRFAPETTDELFSQLLSILPDRISSHLRKGSPAISGPNLLEIFFSESYSFSKNYCERKECLTSLVECCSRLVGTTVRVELKCSPGRTVQAASPTRAGEPESQRVRTAVVDHDPFVQAAQGVFGGQVLEVRRVLGSPSILKGSEESEIEDDAGLDLEETFDPEE